MNYSKIAWRNLWRNKKRSLITISSVFFGVLFSISLTSLQDGSFANMIDNIVSFYSGYIQIQDKEYRGNNTINNSFIPSSSFLKKISENKTISNFSKRLQMFALASSGSESQGVMITGIEPEKENSLSGLSKWVIQGKFLEQGDKGILLGNLLAEKLNVEIGDSVIIIGPGYHGISSAGLFPVIGLLSFPMMELNKMAIYLELENCQQLFSADNRVTNIIINLPDYTYLERVISELQMDVPDELTVLSWEEMNEEIVQFIDGKKSSAVIFKGILFMIIGFGILGTVIMLIAERKRELGVMNALGMKKHRITGVLFLELIFTGLTGVLLSVAVTFPVVMHFLKNPIPIGGEMGVVFQDMGFEPVIKFSGQAWVFYKPAITVFILTVIISTYIVYAIKRLKTVDALRT